MLHAGTKVHDVAVVRGWLHVPHGQPVLIGSRDNCAEDDEGWTTGGRSLTPAPYPRPPRTMSRTMGRPTLMIQRGARSNCLTTGVRTSLRAKTTSTRRDYDTQRHLEIHEGSGDETWAPPDDSKWTDVTVPSNWQDPPLSYTSPNATGWFRRSFTLAADKLKAYHNVGSVMLALGEVAALT